MRFQSSGAICALALSLASCQNNDLRNAVAAVASQVSGNQASVREAAQTFGKAAETLYTHLDQHDMSTKGMDVKDGGIFDTFQNNSYYYKTVHQGAAYYASPMKPVDNSLRSAVRAMSYLEGDIQTAYEKNDDVMALAFFGTEEPQSLGILYPWVDVVSFLPPGLQIRSMEWYTRGLASLGQARWSDGPFVSFYAGWIEDVAVPARVDGKVKGVIVLATSLEKFKTKYFVGRRENLLLLGPDLTVFIATPAARQALPMKVIEDFDYTKQLKANTSPNKGYRLSDDTQPTGLPEVATAIQTGETVIDQTVAGKQWTFYVAEVKETHFWVVGFAPR